MSFERNDKEFNANLVCFIDMYLKDTLLRMNDGLIDGFSERLGIKNIFSGLGFDINDCVLVDDPIFYRNEKCLTYYTVEDLYKNYSGGSGHVLQNIINSH